MVSKTMRSVEKSLEKKPDWAEIYNDQMKEMLDRGIVREVPEEELNSWMGPYYFLPHLAVQQPGKTTPVRICWDAKRTQGGGPSMNSLLFKGPDNLVNDLARVLIGFRFGRLAAMCDIKKMHNRVLLEIEDTFMQLFKWRFLEKEAKEKIFSILVNPFGVSPANTIATVAMHTSADMVKDQIDQSGSSEEKEIAKAANEDIKKQSYIDDILNAYFSEKEAEAGKRMIDRMLQHAGMPSKGWINSGVTGEVELGQEEDLLEKALGCHWKANTDVIIYDGISKWST